MAVYKALPEKFAAVHPRYLSPTVSTIVMAAIAIFYYVVMSIVSTNVLADTITSIGLAITFYYALTGFACAWYFRRSLTSSLRNFLIQGLLPVLGALALGFVFVQSAITYADPEESFTTIAGIGSAFVVGIGALLLGVVLMLVWAAFPQSKPYFRGEALTRDTPVLVPEDEHAIVKPHLTD
jgi:amino acid transporter